MQAIHFAIKSRNFLQILIKHIKELHLACCGVMQVSKNSGGICGSGGRPAHSYDPRTQVETGDQMVALDHHDKRSLILGPGW